MKYAHHLGLTVAGLTFIATMAQAQVKQINLVADLPGVAAKTDPNLVNPWGISFSPTGPLWVADNGSALSTLYKNDGTILSLVVGMPAGSAPTGTVFNGGTGFVVSNGTKSAPAAFLFVSEDGTISGWAPSVNLTHALVAVNNVVPNSVYKGATLATLGGKTMLYAANFREGKVDMFDDTFALVGSFTDSKMPSNYSPFNVKAFGDYIVVTYAETDAVRHDDVAGKGHGFVDVFKTDGTLVRRLARHGALNSPWGIEVAPRGFGKLSGKLLIGNFGDGRINAFDWDGDSEPVRNEHGKPLVIEGLWSIVARDVPKATGDGDGDGDDFDHLLFFSAGPGGESHGLLGQLVWTH